MNSLPLVSVIITTYNRRNLLPYAIQSVLDQTYSNYEIIVVNDCGEDVWDIVQSFDSGKIKYLSHIKNFGVAAARNSAIKAMHGEFVCYLDDDDLFLPEHLQTMISQMIKTKRQMAYSDSFFIDEIADNANRKVKNKSSPYVDIKYSFSKLLISNYIPINTWVHESILLKQVGLFDESLSSHEDWDILIRLADISEIEHVKKKTVEIRNRSDTLNSRSLSTQENWLDDYQEIYNRYPSNSICIQKKRQQIIHALIRKKMIAATVKQKVGILISYIQEKIKLRLLQLAFLYKYKCWDREC